MSALRASVQTCHGCPLYRAATQAVFGEGAVRARAVFVGEVPGDIEDRRGHVFVGPAGRLLDEALEAARISRDSIYLTNAVKHFKFTRRGKRRIHDKPNRYEVEACKPWLDAELALVRPLIVVALGAIAAQALFGSRFRVTEESHGLDFEDTLRSTYDRDRAPGSRASRAGFQRARTSARRVLCRHHASRRLDAVAVPSRRYRRRTPPGLRKSMAMLCSHRLPSSITMTGPSASWGQPPWMTMSIQPS